MEIIEKSIDKTTLKFTVNSNEESLFALLKTYCDKDSSVDIVGYYREHYLLEKTEFVFKVKKGEPLKVFKSILKKVKKDLEKLKLK